MHKPRSMNNLQLRHLENFCRKHGLDIQFIDSALTYHESGFVNHRENKDYLKSLVFDPEERLKKWESMEEWYMENFFLEHYINCIRDGSIVSEDTGPVDASKPLFSLRLMKHVSFSLSAFTEERNTP